LPCVDIEAFCCDDDNDAVDDEGNPLGVMDFWFSLDLWGRSSGGWLGGVSLDTDFKTFHPKLKKINVSSYSAPAFEIMLFYEAIKISLEVGLKLPDAIHALCSKGNADFLATNDKQFYEKWEKTPRLLGVRVESTQKLLDMLRKWKFINK
jgi:hypothetical protein